MFVESRFIRRCKQHGNSNHDQYWRIDNSETQSSGQASDQEKSLMRMFEKDLVDGTASFKFKGRDVQVFLVAGTGFPFESYSPVLEGLARCSWRTHVPTLFDEVLYRHLGLKTDSQISTTARMIDGWFDSENDVFWVMTAEKQMQLLVFLRRLRQKWKRTGLVFKT